MASSIERASNENEWKNRVQRITTELFNEGVRLQNPNLNRTLIYLSQVFQYIENQNNVSKKPDH